MKLVYHFNIGASGHTPPRHERHRSDRSFTIVAENIPTQEEALRGLLPAMINPKGDTMIEMPLGAVVVHPSEQFARKEGVKRAEDAKHTRLVKLLAAVFVPDGRMILHYSLNEVPFVIQVLKGGRPMIDDDNARALLHAERGDWLEEKRKAKA